MILVEPRYFEPLLSQTPLNLDLYPISLGFAFCFFQLFTAGYLELSQCYLEDLTIFN